MIHNHFERLVLGILYNHIMLVNTFNYYYYYYYNYYDKIKKKYYKKNK